MITKYTIKGSCKQGKELTIKGFKNGKQFLSLNAAGIAPKNELDIAIECLKQAIENKKDNQTINLEHSTLTGKKIPALSFYSEAAVKSPVAVCIHGLNTSKTSTIQGAIQLAQEGYYAIVIDAAQHGERKPENSIILNPTLDKSFATNFIQVLKKTAEDISLIIDSLSEHNIADCSRIGLTGNSMGGFIAFLAATYDKRISAIAPLVATPDWSTLFEHPSAASVDTQKRDSITQGDPIHNYTKLKEMAVLIQNNADDPIVNVQGSRNIDPKLRELFFETPERYSYIEYNQSGHNVSAEMFNNVIDWFNTFV